MTFASADAAVLDAVDDSYRAKHASSRYLPPMVAAATRATTVEIRPRPTVAG